MAAPNVCPKCRRERRPGEDACARCGLLVAHGGGFDARPAAHPDLDARWAEVEAAWHDEAAHARFLDEAARLGGLELAAARYRAALDSRPAGEQARARAGLERAARLAVELHAFDASTRPPEPAARWLRLLGISGALGVFLCVLWLLVVALRHR